MNELSTLQNTEVNPQYVKAFRLHAEIMASGETVANALITLMQSLKQMRDEGLYEELGYSSFDDYVEQAVGIKRRQAYNYISSYERLGTRFLQSNAQVGITKLEIIASLPVTERDQFVEDNPVHDMSVRELREATEKIREQGEQISFLQAELEATQAESSEVEKLKAELTAAQKQAQAAQAKEQEIAKLQKQVEELQNRPIEVAVQQPDPVELEKVKKLTQEEAQKKLQSELSKAKKEAEKAYSDQIKSLRQEKEEALERAAALEKKASIAGKPEKEIFKIYFEDLQSDLKRLLDFIATLESTEAQAAYKGAIGKYINMIQSSL